MSELSKVKYFDLGDKFTVSTKRYELRHGKLPKDTEKKEWKFRIGNSEFSFNVKFQLAVTMAKDVARHQENLFIELVP